MINITILSNSCIWVQQTHLSCGARVQARHRLGRAVHDVPLQCNSPTHCLMDPVTPRRACLYADHATVVRFVSNYSPQLCWGVLLLRPHLLKLVLATFRTRQISARRTLKLSVTFLRLNIRLPLAGHMTALGPRVLSIRTLDAIIHLSSQSHAPDGRPA